MSLLKKREGKLGEDLACEFLKKKGYRVIARNFLIRGGEADIIAIESSSDVDTLVFVEVKTRKSTHFGTPLEAITYWKLKALVKTAEFYKTTHKNLPDLMRLDAVSVELDDRDKPIRIELVRNIS